MNNTFDLFDADASMTALSRKKRHAITAEEAEGMADLLMINNYLSETMAFLSSCLPKQ